MALLLSPFGVSRDIKVLNTPFPGDTDHFVSGTPPIGACAWCLVLLKMGPQGGCIGKRKTLFGWGPRGWGLRRVGPACALDADRCPLCSRLLPAAFPLEPPGSVLSWLRPYSARPKRVPSRVGCLPGRHLIFQKVSARPFQHPFVPNPLKGPSLFVKGQRCDSLFCHIPFIAVRNPLLPLIAPPPPLFLRLQNQSWGPFPWKSEIEKLSSFSPLQGKIFSWKGVPWGPGGVPPCPPPGPGDQHLQAGNTQTIVRPGPQGLEKAASLAATTGATTMTTGGWST